MILPISCDAPVYYWPVATVSLIAINTLIFFAMVVGVIDPTNGWVLEYGSGIHAHQWLTSMFAHNDIFHLIGNMIFLWVFGLVTEGKLGWRLFLPCYLLLGVGQSAVEQIIFASAEEVGPGSLGASSAIYGLMAMSLVWAPKNCVTMLVWLAFIIVFTFDVTVMTLALCYIGIDLLVVFITGGTPSSALLHVMGAAGGAALGIVMLKRGRVDCEGWDIFSVVSGNYGAFREKTPDELTTEEKQQREETQSINAKQMFRGCLEAGQAMKALAVRRKMSDMGNPLELSRKELLALIVALHKQREWTESVPVMRDFLEQFPEDSANVRLKLAQICIVELERPAKALELLEEVTLSELAPQQQKMLAKLRAGAHHQIESGVLEVDDGRL